MSTDRQQFDEFLAKFQDCYQSVEVRAVCGCRKGQWRNILTQLTLRSEAKSELLASEPVPVTQVVRAVRAVFPSDRLGDLIDSIQRGFLSLKGPQIAYPGLHDSEDAKGIKLNRFYLRTREQMQGTPEWSHARLSGTGAQTTACLDADGYQIERQLQSLDVPYESLQDLLSGFAGYAHTFEPVPRESLVIVCAPLLVRFSEFRAEGETVKVWIEGARSFSGKRIRISIMEGPSEPRRKRRAMELPKTGWLEDGERVRSQQEMRLTTPGGTVLSLMVEDECAEKLELGNDALPVDGLTEQELSDAEPEHTVQGQPSAEDAELLSRDQPSRRGKSDEALALARGLLEDLEGDENRRKDIAVVLRKARRLAELVGDRNARKWLRYELSGYDEKDPDAKDFMDATGRWSQAESRYATTPLQTQKRTLEDMEATLDAAERLGMWQSIAQLNRTVEATVNLLHEWASATYYRLAFSGEAESIFERYKALVDSRLAKHCPTVLAKMPAVDKRLADGDSEAVSHAMTSCRRVLEVFATTVCLPAVEKKAAEPASIKVSRGKPKNCMRAYIRQQIHSESRRARLSDAVGNLWDQVCKGAHADVTPAEARALFLHTYLFVGELLMF